MPEPAAPCKCPYPCNRHGNNMVVFYKEQFITEFSNLFARKSL